MSATRPLVYVAGPITGDPFGCVRQSADAWDWLRRYGLTPFCPQWSVIAEMVTPQPYERWMSYDLDVLAHCSGLVRLHGDSPGADREVIEAENRGLPILNPHRDGIGQTPNGVVREWADAVHAYALTLGGTQSAPAVPVTQEDPNP